MSTPELLNAGVPKRTSSRRHHHRSQSSLSSSFVPDESEEFPEVRLSREPSPSLPPKNPSYPLPQYSAHADQPTGISVVVSRRLSNKNKKARPISIEGVSFAAPPSPSLAPEEPSSFQSSSSMASYPSTIDTTDSYSVRRHRTSEDSVRSNMSTTSTILSTATKAVKIPKVLMKSMKDFVTTQAVNASNLHSDRRQKRLTLSNPPISHSANDQPPPPSSFLSRADSRMGEPSTRSRKRGVSPMSMFSRKNAASAGESEQSPDHHTHILSGPFPSSSLSLSFPLRKPKETHVSQPGRRRNSVADEAEMDTNELRRVDSKQSMSSILDDEYAESRTSSEIGRLQLDDEVSLEAADEHKPVGKMLFGKGLMDMKFGEEHKDTDPNFDAKSDSVIIKPTQQDVVWGRQRAKSLPKSLQETKSSPLKQRVDSHHAIPLPSSTHNSDRSATNNFVGPRRHSSSEGMTNNRLPLNDSTIPPMPPMPTRDFTKISSSVSYPAGQEHTFGLSSSPSPRLSPSSSMLAAPQKLRQKSSKSLLNIVNQTRSSIITTTLTTLHSSLVNNSEKLVSSLMSMRTSREPAPFPTDKLSEIAEIALKMVDIVDWEEGTGELSQAGMHGAIAEIQGQIISGARMDNPNMMEYLEKGRKSNDKRKEDPNDVTLKNVKEIVSSMKHIANQCMSQYYRTFEKAMVIPSKGWKIEGRNRADDDTDLNDNFYGMGAQHPHFEGTCSARPDYGKWEIEHVDVGAKWFREYFIGNDYRTYCGQVDEEYMLVTIVREPVDTSSSVTPPEMQYRVIVRTKDLPDVRKVIPDSFLLTVPASPPSSSLARWKPLVSNSAAWETVLRTASSRIVVSKMKTLTADQMVASGLEKKLLNFDETALHDRYKFGVLYIKEGQTKEEEWFSNPHDSQKFDQFLDILGFKIDLQGYTGWAGGLDTKSGDSGAYTYTQPWKDCELTYHVATLIPATPGDKQQIQRKRHIGNDIVCVVFVEDAQPFNPAAIKSQFLHVFIVVHEEKRDNRVIYRVEVVTNENVPNFGPPLPEPAVFTEIDKMKAFILIKLINAENAALRSPKFAVPNARARVGNIENLVKDAWKEAVEIDAPSILRQTKSTSSSSDKSQRSMRSTRTIPERDDSLPLIGSGVETSLSEKLGTQKHSVMKELSDGFTSLTRRNSRKKNELDNRTARSGRPKKFVKPDGEDFDNTKRSFSDQDLLSTISEAESSQAQSIVPMPTVSNMRQKMAPFNVTPSTSSARASGGSIESSEKGFRNRKQSILSNITRRGEHDGSGSGSQPINIPRYGSQQQFLEEDPAQRDRAMSQGYERGKSFDFLSRKSHESLSRFVGKGKSDPKFEL